jgi:hypothetical protein
MSKAASGAVGWITRLRTIGAAMGDPNGIFKGRPIVYAKDNGYPTALKCLCCRGFYTHQGEAEVIPGGLSIPITCEGCDTLSVLEVAQCKGQTYVTTRVVKRDPRYGGEILD